MKASPNFSAQHPRTLHTFMYWYLSFQCFFPLHALHTLESHSIKITSAPIRASTLHLLFRRIFEKASLDGPHLREKFSFPRTLTELYVFFYYSQHESFQVALILNICQIICTNFWKGKYSHKRIIYNTIIQKLFDGRDCFSFILIFPAPLTVATE